MKYWRTPLDAAEIEVSRGLVTILEERCKGCGYCIAFCPRDVLELANRYNAKGYRPPMVKKPDACVNCHYCEIICPDLAIYSTELPSEAEPRESHEQGQAQHTGSSPSHRDRRGRL